MSKNSYEKKRHKFKFAIGRREFIKLISSRDWEINITLLKVVFTAAYSTWNDRRRHAQYPDMYLICKN